MALVPQVCPPELVVCHVCKLIVGEFVRKVLSIDGFYKLKIGLVDLKPPVPVLPAVVCFPVSFQPGCVSLFHHRCFIRWIL